MGLIVVRVNLNPQLAPRIGDRVTWKERFISIKGVWGVLVLAFLVTGGIFLGFFTPTEAGGVGAFGAFLMALLRRRLNRSSLKDALLDTARTTATIFIIVVGAYLFTRFLAVTQFTTVSATWVVSLPLHPIVLLSGMILVLIFLGCFLDPLGMMLLTMPIFFPVILKLGINPILFGILVMITLEMANITPPFGLNLFVIKGVVPGATMADIIVSIVPFVFVDILVIIVLIAFPSIALFLPNLMAAR